MNIEPNEDNQSNNMSKSQGSSNEYNEEEKLANIDKMEIENKNEKKKKKISLSNRQSAMYNFSNNPANENKQVPNKPSALSPELSQIYYNLKKSPYGIYYF